MQVQLSAIGFNQVTNVRWAMSHKTHHRGLINVICSPFLRLAFLCSDITILPYSSSELADYHLHQPVMCLEPKHLSTFLPDLANRLIPARIGTGSLNLIG